MHSSISAIAQRRGVRQFVKFGVVGFSGLLVNLAIFTLLQRLDANHALAWHYYVLYSISFLAGGVSNYWLNRVWTFRSTGHAGSESIKFLSVSVIALMVGWLASWIVAPSFGHGHKTWLVATLAGIFVNFFVNKFWTFRGAQPD